MRNNNQLPPNGVMIFLDAEGDWILSANRFKTVTVNESIHVEMLAAAVEETGMEEYEILDKLPSVGEDIGQCEQVQRVVASLEEASKIASGLWAWLTGLEEEFPTPCDCGEDHI